jgi:hypothetical protein
MNDDGKWDSSLGRRKWVEGKYLKAQGQDGVYNVQDTKSEMRWNQTWMSSLY